MLRRDEFYIQRLELASIAQLYHDYRYIQLLEVERNNGRSWFSRPPADIINFYIQPMICLNVSLFKPFKPSTKISYLQRVCEFIEHEPRAIPLIYGRVKRVSGNV